MNKTPDGAKPYDAPLWARLLERFIAHREPSSSSSSSWHQKSLERPSLSTTSIAKYSGAP